VGDIEVHRSKGTNYMLDSEFILEVNVKGGHSITISNEVRAKKSGE
jgi:hypothetical protein